MIFMMSEQIIITFNKTREDISTLLDQQVRINQALREEFASKSRKLETLVKKKQELEKPDANLDDLAAEIEKFSTQLVESVVRKQKELSEMSRKVSTEETDQL